MRRTKIQELFLIAQIRKMAEECLSVAQMAEKLKLPYQTTNNLRKKAGIQLKKDSKMIDKIKELAEKKYSVRNIAEELGRNVHTVFDYMIKYNIPRANVRKKNVLVIPNEIIKKMKEMSEKNMSVRKISKEINKSEMTAYRYMVKCDIPRNGRMKK